MLRRRAVSGDRERGSGGDTHSSNIRPVISPPELRMTTPTRTKPC